MWQEILVGIIVALCAGFIIRRYWRNLRSAQQGGVSCSCDCTGCDKQTPSASCDDAHTK